MIRHDIILSLDGSTRHATLLDKFTCGLDCRETHTAKLENPHQVAAWLIDLAFQALACEEDLKLRQLALTQAVRKFTFAGRGEGNA